MGGYSRVTVGVVAALVAASVVAGAGLGGATASDHVDVEQNGATLSVTVDQSAFDGNDTGNATIAVSVAGIEVANGTEPATTGSGANEYRVNLTTVAGLAGKDLSSANVTVSPESGEQRVFTELDLRHVGLADEADSFYDSHQLVLPVGTKVGIPDDAKVDFAGSAGDESGTLTATLREDGSELVVTRDETFAALTFAGPQLSINSTGGLSIDGEPYDIRGVAEEPTVTSVGPELTVTHPLLFDGREYTVTITAHRNGSSVVTTRTDTAENASLTVNHGGTVSAGMSVEITHSDVSLGNANVSQTSPNASLSPDSQSIMVDGQFDGRGTTNVTIFDDPVTGEIRYLSDVPYENGTVRFGEAGDELANASYALVFELDNGNAFTASLDAEDEPAAVNAAGDGGGSTVPSLDTGFESPLLLIAAGGGALAIVFFGVIMVLGRSDSAESVEERKKMDVDVRIIDGFTNNPINQPHKVKFHLQRSKTFGGSETRKVAGEGTVSVPLAARHASLASVEGNLSDKVSPRDPNVELKIPPQERQICVETAALDTGIPGASVEVVFPDGSSDKRTTNNDGIVQFKIPFSVNEKECKVSIDHDRFQPTTVRGLSGAITLEPQTGNITIDARLDGEPVPGVDVFIEPDDEYTSKITNSKTRTVDDTGVATFNDLPEGKYTARLDFGDSSTVETAPVTVDVTADERAAETVDAEFSFEIDDDQRARIDELHRDIADLTPSNRDGAVPYYFGSVLSEVLSTVDEFPETGVEFVRHGVDPEDVTDATIAAVGDVLEYTRAAMTKKQNVDLFSACRGLREARVTWDGDVTVADLVVFLGDEKANHRRKMIGRLESVDDVLNEKQNAVSTVTPARDQYDQVRDHATGLQELSPTAQRAHFFVGLEMLDAIEAMFEEPELVDRLDETVF